MEALRCSLHVVLSPPSNDWQPCKCSSFPHNSLLCATVCREFISVTGTQASPPSLTVCMCVECLFLRSPPPAGRHLVTVVTVTVESEPASEPESAPAARVGKRSDCVSEACLEKS